jgi:serine/threonine-protein kinase HipA
VFGEGRVPSALQYLHHRLLDESIQHRRTSKKDGHLAIAKFPSEDDEINTVVWESVALALAKKAGITVPAARVETIAKKPMLLLRRFDRNGKQRIPFLSAMSMFGSKDNDTRSYLEIVEALRQHGAEPKADMEALWRRLVFSILISNTDDHLLCGPGGLASVAGV